MTSRVFSCAKFSRFSQSYLALLNVLLLPNLATVLIVKISSNNNKTDFYSAVVS